MFCKYLGILICRGGMKEMKRELLTIVVSGLMLLTIFGAFGSLGHSKINADHDPTLTLNAEFGGDGVTPNCALTQETFMFSVIYHDSDGDIPTVTEVKIDGKSYSMNTQDGNKYYFWIENLPDGLHHYSFHFENKNGNVKLPSILNSWCFIVLSEKDCNPQLMVGNVDIEKGVLYDRNYNFRVIYKDEFFDQNECFSQLPEVSKVVIDDELEIELWPRHTVLGCTKFERTRYSNDFEVSNGKHSYYFYFEDYYGHGVRYPEEGMLSFTVNKPTSKSLHQTWSQNLFPMLTKVLPFLAKLPFFHNLLVV